MKPDEVVLLESLLGEIVRTLTPALRNAGIALEILVAGQRQGRPARQRNTIFASLIDDTRFTVRWQGRECHLGATVLFHLFRRIVLSANRYLSIQQLLEDVWGGSRSVSAVRSAIRNLRRKLEAAGLGDLARAIDGQPGHYALLLDRVSPGNSH